MTTAFFDCQAGASGNMILGALLDAGLDKSCLLAELRKLDLPPGNFATNASSAASSRPASSTLTSRPAAATTTIPTPTSTPASPPPT